MRTLVFMFTIVGILSAEVSMEFYKSVQECGKLFAQKKIMQGLKKAKQTHALAKSDEEKSYILQFISNGYMEAKDYKSAIKYLKKALVVKGAKKVDIYKNLSFCYYDIKNYKNSFLYAKKYIAKNKKDKNMIKLLYVLSMKTKDYKKGVYYYELLHKNEKKDEKYFVGLASLHVEAKSYKDALISLDFAYKKGLLKSKNAINMYLYALQMSDLYEKAAIVVRDNRAFFNDYEDKLLGLYMRAKDYKSIISYIKNSPQASDKNRLMLARIYFKNRDFKKSISTLKKLKFSKNSKNKGEVYMLLAYNYYYLKDEKSLSLVLQKAISNSYAKKRAKKMLNHLNSM